jgi:chromosome segregation ATPase
MKNKIFAKLKQEYSSLGLGDEILQAHAESLADSGFVTDENIDTVVSGQKSYLSALQRLNDSRVSKALEKQRKDIDDEAKKQREEAEAKAEKERKEREEKAKAEAEKKQREDEEKAAAEKRKKEEEAQAEAERKRQEELAKNQEIPEWFKKLQEENSRKATEERQAQQKARKALEEQLKALSESNTQKQGELKSLIDELRTQNTRLQGDYDAIKQERDRQAAEAARRDRESKILDIAKELGIPQYRIDEGFAIADDAADDAIRTQLAVVAQNIKASNLPSGSGTHPMGDNKPTKDEVDAIAKSIVK